VRLVRVHGVDGAHPAQRARQVAAHGGGHRRQQPQLVSHAELRLARGQPQRDAGMAVDAEGGLVREPDAAQEDALVGAPQPALAIRLAREEPRGDGVVGEGPRQRAGERRASCIDARRTPGGVIVVMLPPRSRSRPGRR
jgi:hypothetical protein